MSYQIPQNIRTILEPLAEAVFPISGWAEDRWLPFDKWLGSPAAKRAKLLATKPARQHLQAE
jgi:hypothetical protein